MKRLAAAVMAALSLLLVGCGDGSDDVVGDQSVGGKQIKALDLDLTGVDLLGLTVQKEDVSGTLATAKRSYVDATSLYSLRTEELLQATLQVSKFTDESRYTSPSFRNTLLGRIGGSKPRSVRLGDETVWLASATKQQLAVWFRGQHMFVLATRDDFDKPRTLLRKALEVKA